MKSKFKKLLIGSIPFFALLLSGCSLMPRGKSSSSSSTSDDYVMPEGEPDTPDTGDETITAITMKRSRYFFMRVGEKLDFNVTFTGKGDDSQKGIAWTSSNPSVLSVQTKEKTYQCVLTAHKEGTVTLKAQSTYVESISKTVQITVVDDSVYTNFWHKTSDIAENKNFNDKYGQIQQSGTARLGENDWQFQFEHAQREVDGGQFLKFGSNDSGFGEMTFTLPNTKQIKKITVYCSSSPEHIDDGSEYGKTGTVGSSNIDIKIGETTYLASRSTPKTGDYNNAADEEVTGGNLSTPLTGDIKIHFTAAHYYGAEGGDYGSISIKSINIEYYRGELQTLTVSDYRDQYYVGTTFDKENIKVTAKFSVYPVSGTNNGINVSRFAYITVDNLDSNGKFITDNPTQAVSVRYRYEDQELTESYNVVVSKAPKGVYINGTLAKNEYLVNEDLSYEGLTVDIVVPGDTDDEVVESFYLKDYLGDEFQKEFDTSSIVKTASKSLVNGFTISLKHKLTGQVGTFEFEKDDLVVKDVTKIDVYYGDGTEEYTANLNDGDKMSFAGFNVDVTYDNDDVDTFALTSLDSKRYDYTTYTPLVVDESFETDGFTISVHSKTNSIVGDLDIAAGKVTVKSISKLTLSLDSVTFKKDYKEYETMNYTGISLRIDYDNETNTTMNYTEMKEAYCYRLKIAEKTGNHSAEKTPLFEITAPERASMAMENDGFSYAIAHTRSTLTDTLNIDAGVMEISPYTPKTFERVTSETQIVANAKYIITHINSDGKSMNIWDNQPSRANNQMFSAANYYVYTHTSDIGASLQIYDAAAEDMYFTFVINSGTETTYNLKRQNGATLSQSNSFSTNTPAEVALAFEADGNAIFVANTKRIYFAASSTTNRFNLYAVKESYTDTYTPIQIYKMVEASA